MLLVLNNFMKRRYRKNMKHEHRCTKVSVLIFSHGCLDVKKLLYACNSDPEKLNEWSSFLLHSGYE